MWEQAEKHLRAADNVMPRLIDRIGPYPDVPPLVGGHFEAIAQSIVFQQLSGRAASVIFSRLLALCNETKPTPRAIMSLSDEQLRGAGLSRQKSATLKDLSAKAEAGDVRIDSLHDLPDEEIIRELTLVKGIGVWTAQMFLMFRLHRPDVLPDMDLGIRKAIRNEYVLPELPAPEKVQEIGSPWRPFATYACWYLWRSLDTVLPDNSREQSSIEGS
jgi:3-methyladenine DNA glycosylase/8-oxoguanine DNA glycosylase